MEFCVVEMLSSILGGSQRFGQDGESFFYLPYFPIRLSAQSKPPRTQQLGSCHLKGGYPLLYPCNPCLPFAPLDHRPPQQYVSHGSPKGEPVLCRDGDERFCKFLDDVGLPTPLVHLHFKAKGEGETERVRQPPGEGQRLVRLLHGAIGIAQEPQDFHQRTEV